MRMNGKKDLLNDTAWEVEISEFLTSYTAKAVDEEKIDKTVDVLREYMPKAKEKYKLLKLFKNEITYVNRVYWIISMLVIIFGFFITNQQNYSIYKTLLCISPIPIILGIYEAERGKREKTWELEKSFKHSYSKIMVTKILIILSFTTILNMLISLLICSGQESCELIRIMTAWIAPISIVFLVNIIISSKISSNYSMMITTALWILTLVLGSEKIINFIERAKILSLIITISISIGVFLLTISKFYNYAEKYEGELSWS